MVTPLVHSSPNIAFYQNYIFVTKSQGQAGKRRKHGFSLMAVRVRKKTFLS